MVEKELFYNILKILKGIYDFEPFIPNPCQNERYLHHYFSHKVQELYPIIYNDLINSKLHPEWPTFKSNVIEFSKYKNIGNNIYEINETGSEGSIDFTFGEYKYPTFAIEFSARYNWNGKDICYDIIKLLDSKIKCIEKSISFNIIFRDKQLPNEYQNKKDKFINAMNKAKDNAKTELEKNNRLCKSEKRQYLIWVIEIAKEGDLKKRSWFLRDLKNNFIEGFPDIEQYKNK